MKFELLKTDPASNARRGRIRTDHGTIETPIFMPVGTVGSVKGVYHRDLKADIGLRLSWAIPIISICGPAWILSAWPEVCISSQAGTARY